MKFLKQTLFFIIVGITISITFCSTTYAATAYSKLSLPPSQSSEDNLADSSDRSLHTTKYVVTSAQATLRTGPGNNYSSAGTVKKGNIILVVSISNNWAKFKLRNNPLSASSGFLASQFQRQFRIHDNLASNLGNGFVYLSAFLDAVGCGQAASEKLGYAEYAVHVLSFRVGGRLRLRLCLYRSVSA